MFNIGIYILALILGVFIGSVIYMIIEDKTDSDFQKKEKDGLIYVVPKPARSEVKSAEQEWRDGCGQV